MKILDLNNMLDAASEIDMPDLARHIDTIEQAATELAEALATHLGVKAGAATYLRDFGGLCASFRPAFKGSPCPKAIHDGDPDGDWE